jgi:hypothetical protein
LKLEPFLPGDIEDVALEALEELVEKVREIRSIDVDFHPVSFASREGIGLAGV